MHTFRGSASTNKGRARPALSPSGHRALGRSPPFVGALSTRDTAIHSLRPDFVARNFGVRNRSTRGRQASQCPALVRALAAETTVGQSINAFAEALYSQLQSQPGGSGNLFLSPASISTALAMTYAGARGETATQMASALHYTLGADALSSDFGSLIADLNSAGQGKYSLSVADALWGQQGYSFLASFLSLMQADYGGGLHQVDFKNAAEAARQTINNWVATKDEQQDPELDPRGRA